MTSLTTIHTHISDHSDGFLCRTFCGLDVRDLPRHVDDAAPTCPNCLTEETLRDEEAVRRLADDNAEQSWDGRCQLFARSPED